MNSMEHSRVWKWPCLIRAQVLHGEGINDLEFVTRNERINPPQGGLEVPNGSNQHLGHAVNRRRMRACLPTERQTNQNVRPPSESKRSGNYWLRTKFGVVTLPFGHNLRVIGRKGGIELNGVQAKIEA